MNSSAVRAFKTRAGIVLYEICATAAPSGFTDKLPWRDYQAAIRGKAIPSEKWGQFKQRALVPALAEIAQLAPDIGVEMLVHKDKQRIADLQFKVTHHPT